MTMGEEDARQSLKSGTRLQNLALGPFAAINKEAVFVMGDYLPGEPAFGRGRRSGRTKKEDFKQSLVLKENQVILP